MGKRFQNAKVLVSSIVTKQLFSNTSVVTTKFTRYSNTRDQHNIYIVFLKLFPITYFKTINVLFDKNNSHLNLKKIQLKIFICIFFRLQDIALLCRNIFHSCSWNGKSFNCCRHFQPHRFVIGTPCFAINSLQTINK